MGTMLRCRVGAMVGLWDLGESWHLFALGSVAVTGDRGPGVCGSVNWVSLWVVVQIPMRLDRLLGFCLGGSRGLWSFSRFRGKWVVMEALEGSVWVPVFV